MELKKIKKIWDSMMGELGINSDEGVIVYLQMRGLTVDDLMELGYHNEWRRAFEDPHKWDVDEDDENN